MVVLILEGYIERSPADGIRPLTPSGKVRVVPITRRIWNLLSELMAGRSGDALIFSPDGAAPCGDRAIR